MNRIIPSVLVSKSGRESPSNFTPNALILCASSKRFMYHPWIVTDALGVFVTVDRQNLYSVVSGEAQMASIQSKICCRRREITTILYSQMILTWNTYCCWDITYSHAVAGEMQYCWVDSSSNPIRHENCRSGYPQSVLSSSRFLFGRHVDGAWQYDQSKNCLYANSDDQHTPNTSMRIRDTWMQ